MAPRNDASTRAIVAEAREVIASMDQLVAATRDGGPVPATLVRRLVDEARDHCEGARALTAQSPLQISRSQRLEADAENLRRRDTRREDR